MNRFLHWCAFSLWWFSIILVLFVTLALASFRLGLEHLTEDTDSINSYLHSIVDRPITLEKLDMDWRGAVPVITVDRLKIGGEQVVVDLGTIELQPLLVQSAVNLEFQLDLVRAQAGSIEIFLDKFKGERTSINDVFTVIANVLNASNYLFSDIELIVHSNGKTQSVYLQSAKGIHTADGWTLDVQAKVDGLLDQAHIIFEQGSSTIDSWDKLDGRAYINLDLSQSRNQENLISLPRELQLSDGKVELWFDFVDGVPKFIQLHLDDAGIDYKNQKYTAVSTSLIARRNSHIPDAWLNNPEKYLGTWDVYIPHIAFYQDSIRYSLDKLFVSQVNDGQGLWVSAGKINTERIVPLMVSLMPEWQHALNMWPVIGEFHNLYGYIPLSKPGDIIARASVNDLTVGSKSNEVLQISATSARLSVADSKALISIDNAEEITVNIAAVYDHVLNFTQPATQIIIDWHDRDMVRISTRNMFVRLPPMSTLVDLDYRLDLLQPHLSNFMLHTTADNIPFAFRDKFIPYKLISDDLLYLSRTKTTGDGIFSGDMLLFLQQGKTNEPFGLAMDLHLETESASILDQGYPELRDIKGSVDINFSEINAKVASLNIADSSIKDLDIYAAEGRVKIYGRVTDSLKDLRTLVEAYNTEIPLDMPGKLVTQGDIAADFNFFFPVEQPERIDSDIKITLLDNLLYHEDYSDLPISQLNGSFRIAGHKLSQKKNFRGTFADKPLVFGMQNTSLDSKKILRFFADFTLPGEIINRLFALKVPLVTGSGDINVLLDFNQASGEFERLIVKSPLTGIASDIPLSLGKKAGDKAPLQFVLEREDNKDMFVHLKVQDRIKGTMLIDHNNVMTGWIGVGRAARQPIAVSDKKLKIVASYETIDVSVLVDWFKAKKLDEVLQQKQSKIKGTLMNNLVETTANQNQDATFDTAWFNTLNIEFSAQEIGTSNFFVNQAHGFVVYSDNQWILDITSDLLSSRIVYAPSKDTQKIDVDKLVVQKIVLPDDKDGAEASETVTADPLETFDPRITNTVHLHIKHLIYDDDDLGEWSMRLEPEAKGLRLADLRATKDSLVMQGSAFWQHFPDREPGQRQETTVRLSIVGSDINNLGGLVDSKSGIIDADLRWPASPIGVAVNSLRGTINVAFEDGNLRTREETVALLNLVGLLNIETIGKRLSLNFSDQGGNVSFDKMHGKVRIQDGIISHLEPFIFSGPSINIQIDGTTNIVKDEVKQTMVVHIPLGKALPLATVIAGLAPQISVVLLVTNYALQKPFTKFTSARFLVTGSTSNPKLVLDKLFDVDLED